MYLSSFRLGNHPERLVALLGRAGPVSIIANASDPYPAEGRRQGVERELAELHELGIDSTELDLREYFGKAERLRAVLERCSGVWVRGGNTFALRHALAASGADGILVELVRRDALVYSGYSAGVCVLAPTLHGLELVDDPGQVAKLYGVPARWDGLGLLDHMILPHFESPGHPETEAVGRAVPEFVSRRLPHRTLRDGEAIVIEGTTMAVV